MAVGRTRPPCPGTPAHVLARCILAALAWLAPAFDFDGALDQPTGSAVEYYHAGFDHYFMTARQSEITLLDGGAFGGV
jgi:hypothetical protein